MPFLFRPFIGHANRLRSVIAVPAWHQLTRIPFIAALLHEPEVVQEQRFADFAKQDYVYLGHYLSVVDYSMAQTRCDHAQAVLGKLALGAHKERACLRDDFDVDGTLEPVMLPELQRYVSFLRNVSAVGEISVTLASLAPCLAIYTDVAAGILANPRHPLRSWAYRSYSPLACAQMFDYLNRSCHAPYRQHMRAVTEESSWHEVAFFKAIGVDACVPAVHERGVVSP